MQIIQMFRLQLARLMFTLESIQQKYIKKTQGIIKDCESVLLSANGDEK